MMNFTDTYECVQVMLINAAKDVASALSHLVNSAKNASGKQASDPAMGSLKESAKVSLMSLDCFTDEWNICRHSSCVTLTPHLNLNEEYMTDVSLLELIHIPS